MGKTQQEYLNDLALIAFQIDDKANELHERTKRLRRMAKLSMEGKKETEEFKSLEREFRHPTVIDFGDEINDLQRVVKQLRRYKWKQLEDSGLDNKLEKWD